MHWWCLKGHPSNLPGTMCERSFRDKPLLFSLLSTLSHLTTSTNQPFTSPFRRPKVSHARAHTHTHTHTHTLFTPSSQLSPLSRPLPPSHLPLPLGVPRSATHARTHTHTHTHTHTQ